MEYLDRILWGSFPDDCSNIGPQFEQEMPRIAPITEMWQQQKCDLLGIPFHSPSIHPTTVAGHLLCNYQPWETTSIEGDGNCFFRCLAKIITGNQDSHQILCSLITYFIASKEMSELGWYFKQKQITPRNYLLYEREIYCDGVWATDVEIMATSAILDADIYVANNIYTSTDKLIRETRWSLIRSKVNDDKNPSLYISNFGHHFEHVISMINSQRPTYGNIAPKKISIV